MSPLDKQTLRSSLFAQRNAVSKDLRHQYSKQIQEQVIAKIQTYPKDWIIGCYASFASEVETHELIEQLLFNHRVALPACKKDTMEFYEITSLDLCKPSKMHILEPINQEQKVQPQLLLVPLLGFDEKGYRIGYGKGYYDRYLSCHTCKSIGLAFSFQRCENCCFDEWDLAIDEIINE